jgi:hypothetical protein
VFISQNKPVTSNQPAVLFSQNKSALAISHQQNEQAASLKIEKTTIDYNINHHKSIEYV